MYITNIKSIPQEKVYKCRNSISHWLQYEQHLPLLGKEGDFYYFAKTYELEQALLKLPFWLKFYAYS